MTLLSPKIVEIKPNYVWQGRTRISAVFVRKHNLQANQEVVEDKTKEITELTAKDWLLLVEGYKNYHTVENQFLDGFAENLDIRTEDPIIKPFTTEVAQAASVEQTIAALSILTMDYLDLIADHNVEQLDQQLLEMMFNQGLETVAKAFEVSPKVLKREFNKLKWHNEEKLARQIITLSEKRKQLISESNSQSKVKVGEVLTRNLHPHLFIMSGIEHATIFTQ